MQRRIVCCLNLITGLCSAAIALGCSPKGTFIRAEGIPPERSAVAKGTSPEVYVAGVRGYSSPAALSGGEPIWAVGLVTVEASEGAKLDVLLEEAKRQGERAGCEVLIDLATYGPRYPAFRGKTSWSGLVDWEFVCGVHSGGTEASAASSLPYPDFVQTWGSVNMGSAYVRCVNQPPASNRMGRTECMYRTRGTGVRNDMCTNCSTGYVNDLDGIPLRVNWQNRVSFPISEP